MEGIEAMHLSQQSIAETMYQGYIRSAFCVFFCTSQADKTGECLIEANKS
jgi:hypothetical protein